MRKLVIANWKMNPQTLDEARRLFQSTEHRMHLFPRVEAVVCAPFIYLPPLSHYSSAVKLGAQNVFWEEAGAFTGEISPTQLRNWKIEYVILGHSERRLFLLESDAMVNLKVHSLLKHKVTPIICLGGDKAATKSVMKRLVSKQYKASVKGLDKKQIEKTVFVYEPTWAISTSKNAEPATGAHAAELVTHIRKQAAVPVKVLYGGSVNKKNVNEFARYPEIDGALIGAASLDYENFGEIIKEFNRESIHKVI